MRKHQIESLLALASIADAVRRDEETRERALSGLASMSKGNGPAEDTWTPDRAATEHHLRQASLLWAEAQSGRTVG